MTISLEELRAHRLLHAMGTYPTAWPERTRALAESPASTAADITAFLAASPAAPFTRRVGSYGYASTFYPGRATSDPRIALYDVLEISKLSGIDDKKLKRVLGDPHARGVIGLDVQMKSAWKVLLEGLSASPIESIRYLRGEAVPSAEQLAELLAHPKLAGLERLVLGGDGTALGDARIAAVAAMPHASTLRQLWLDGLDKLTSRSFDLLGGAPFGALRSLAARSSTWIPRASARQSLFAAPWLSSLRTLVITDVSEDELSALRTRLPLGELVSLGMTLRGGNTPAPPGLSTSVIAELRACQALAISPTDADAVPALIASGCVPHLEELLIRDSRNPALTEAGLATGQNPGDLTKNRRFAEEGFWWRWD